MAKTVRILKVITGILALIFAAVFTTVPTNAEPVLRKKYGTETITIRTPPGFKLAFKPTADTFEFSPTKETVDNWKRLITVYVSTTQLSSLEQTRELQKKTFLKDCDRSARLIQINNQAIEENGRTTLEWVIGCSKIIAGASKGKPEVNVIRAIAGKDVDVFLFYAFRYMPSKAEINAARRQLRVSGSISS